MRTARTLAVTVTLLVLARVCSAAEQDPCDTGAGDSDVQFSLNLKGGQTVFREGEMVPLVLALSTSSSRYWVNTASYDRSGRLGIETYCVDPEGPDPMEENFRRGGFGGGLSSNLHLVERPFTLEAALNQWQRLPPGHYRAYAVSRRVHRAPEAGEASDTGEIGLSVKSNLVEFEVVPADEGWERDQIQVAVSTLSSSAKDDDRTHAARVLRFLGTRASTEAIAKVFSGETRDAGQYDLMLGLYSSPLPDVAVKSMRAQFAVPGHGISGQFLDTLVRLQTDLDPAWNPRGDEPTPPDFWNRYQAHYRELMHAEVGDLASVVSRKTGTARAVTLNGMLRQVSDDPALVGSIRPALIACWKDLPAETQQEMLIHFWQAIDTPEMLPILREIVALPPAPSRSVMDEMRSAALRHIYEFDPAEGTALIARDLANPEGSPTMENVHLLTPAQIQAAVPAAAERLRRNVPRGVDYELIDQYGDAGVLGSVQAVLENKERDACGSDSHLLRYLLRVAPEYGVEQVRLAMGSRKQTRCFTNLLQELGDQLPKAQQIAIEALNDAEPEVQQDAVIALTRWGTAEAEEPLWKRLERFHDEWSGRVSELRRSPDFRDEGSQAVWLEQSLAQGIAWGNGWICPPEKLARLAKLVLTDYDRRQASNSMDQWKGSTHQISSSFYPPDAPRFSLMGYSDLTEDQLRAKVEQFPRGTTLEWLIWLPGQTEPPVDVSRQEEVFERVRSDAASHGLVVVKRMQQ